MPVIRLTWDNPPDLDDPTVAAREDIAVSLQRRIGKWAIVAWCDRAARAASIVERVNDGREYGDGFEATARRVGNQHRVYARSVGTNQD